MKTQCNFLFLGFSKGDVEDSLDLDEDYTFNGIISRADGIFSFIVSFIFR